MAKSVTIRTVAARAGVSVSTVSASFDPTSRISAPTREKVIAVANQLGWRPDRRAKKLRQSTSRLLGVIYEVNRPFQSSLVDSLYAAAAQSELDIILTGATKHHSELECLRLILGERCDALVVTGSTLEPAHLQEAGRMLPTLSLARATAIPGVDCVYSDATVGQKLAVQHLYDLGHRNIAHIGGTSRSMSLERQNSYLQAMTALGLETYAHIFPFGDDSNAGIAAADMLAEMTDRPSAVTCYNDTVAAALVTRLRQLGKRVPEDLSVVGYDDLPLASESIHQLTTIRQDGQAMCRLALELVNQHVTQGTTSQAGEENRVSMMPTLIRRHSTARRLQ